MSQHWRLCSSCKQPIGYRTTYWVCSVSTCNRPRTGLTFCSVPCWEAHLPIVRHREAFAVEATSPSREQAEAEAAAEAAEAAAPEPEAPATARKVVTTAQPEHRTTYVGASDEVPIEVLIVASKLKKYIRARSGLNTSDAVMDRLSDLVRELCDRAIRNAAQSGRKTVMDRDFPDRL